MNNKSLPTIALSVRQPWAWLIVNGFKDIENRSWPSNFRGRVLIHASKGLTKREYLECLRTVQLIDTAIDIPPFDQLDRGGFVGAVNIVDVVTAKGSGVYGQADSNWFFGPYGFKLEDPEIIPFTPWRGQLGFFTAQIDQPGEFEKFKVKLFLVDRSVLNIHAAVASVIGHDDFKISRICGLPERPEVLGVVVESADFPVLVRGAKMPHVEVALHETEVQG